MPGILIGGMENSGRKVDIAYIDYGSVITQTGTLADVHLVTTTPRAYPDGMFGFEFARVNPEPLGLELDAPAIEMVWKQLQNAHFPLEEVMTGLLLWDIIETLREIPAQTPGMVHHYCGTTPSFARLVEMVGHIGEIQKFKPEDREGFESRLGELRRNLNGIYRGKRLGQTPLIEYLRTIKEAAVAIMAKESEFNILKQVLTMGHKCKLFKSGSDLIISDAGNLRCEVKSRHENIFQGVLNKGQGLGIIGPNPITLSPEIMLALLSWSIFATIRRAMDEQKSHLVFCDLSHTFVGVLLPAIEKFWKIDLSFPQAVEKALASAGEGSQTALVFISLPGVNHHLKATVFQRSDIEDVGKTIWDMNKSLALHSPELARFLSEAYKSDTGNGNTSKS